MTAFTYKLHNFLPQIRNLRFKQYFHKPMASVAQLYYL